MKKNKGKILLITIAALAGFFLILYLLPCLFPIHVIYNPLNGYTYTVYADHVKLEEYWWNKEHVKIPDYMWGRPVTVIDNSCFYGYSLAYRANDIRKIRIIETIELPKYLEKIGDMAFGDLTELKAVRGGENVEYIGTHAFIGCKQLKEIEFGYSVEYIGSSAFFDCTELAEFAFSSSIKEIGSYAFMGTLIDKLPKQMECQYIGTGAFWQTPWMETQIGEFVIYNDILLDYNGEEEIVVLPEGIRGIAGAFKWNETVKEIYIPEGTEYVDARSFYGEGVRVYIPASVTLLGKVTEESDGSFLGTFSDSDITIITTSGSVAEQYAIENNIPYEIVEGW